MLGNFEYRIPIFGPASFAAFADIGAVFNLRTSGIQQVNSEFLRDDIFVGAGTIASLAQRNAPTLAPGFGSFFIYQNTLLTTERFRELFCNTNPNCGVSAQPGITQVFLRGDVQTNAQLELDNAAFSDIGDFRASIGGEFRVQVPVVNVPFRLIYFYNPNARIGITPEVPLLRFPGRRSGWRFSVGRTF